MNAPHRGWAGEAGCRRSPALPSLASAHLASPAPLVPGAFVGGFECSSQRRADGRRLDLLAATGHDRLAAEDYRLLQLSGIGAARDGLRWHLIEAEPGRYDWSSVLPMLRAARRSGLRVIWDLCHYGWPDDLDIFSPAFVDRFARFAVEAARIVAEESDEAPAFCAVNEISYWAWAGGEVGRFAPATRGRGGELKRQLVLAALAGTRAIRAALPRARFLHAEPAIHVAPGDAAPGAVAAAAVHDEAQFEALDMMAGRLAPELGGDAALLDVVGVNFYPDNQWHHGGGTIPLGHHAYRPLRDMLADIHLRYGRPLMISETGAEGSARASWLHYVCGEVRAARDAGVPIEAVCLYPVLDYPGWDDDRPCAAGLFSAPDRSGRRRVDPEFAAEVGRQRCAFGRAA